MLTRRTPFTLSKSAATKFASNNVSYTPMVDHHVVYIRTLYFILHPCFDSNSSGTATNAMRQGRKRVNVVGRMVGYGGRKSNRPRSSDAIGPVSRYKASRVPPDYSARTHLVSLRFNMNILLDSMQIPAGIQRNIRVVIVGPHR